jgi:hypothetical protein
VALTGGSLLTFVPVEDPMPKKGDGHLDWAAIRCVRIIEIDSP